MIKTDIRIIKSPGEGTLEILKKRSSLNFDSGKPGAVGLVQGKIIEMICAADTAEKCAGVIVSDVRGSCPQNLVLLAIVGEIADVEEALKSVKEKSEVNSTW